MGFLNPVHYKIIKMNVSFLTHNQLIFLHSVLDLHFKWNGSSASSNKFPNRINTIIKLGSYDGHHKRFLSNEVTNYYKKWINIETWYNENLCNHPFKSNRKFEYLKSDTGIFTFENLDINRIIISTTNNGILNFQQIKLPDAIKHLKSNWELL